MIVVSKINEPTQKPHLLLATCETFNLFYHVPDGKLMHRLN